jgi:hypothetical protein
MIIDDQEKQRLHGHQFARQGGIDKHALNREAADSPSVLAGTTIGPPFTPVEFSPPFSLSTQLVFREYSIHRTNLSRITLGASELLEISQFFTVFKKGYPRFTWRSLEDAC